MSIRNYMFHHKSRKYKVLRISPALFFNNALFNVRTEESLPARDDGSRIIRTVYHDLPEGTEIEAATFDEFTGSIMLRLWNDSWEEVGETCTIPDILITFTTTSFVIVPGGKNEDGETVYQVESATPAKFREFL